MHILVIGGAGYIGSHVVKALLNRGMDVTVFDNLSTGTKINLFAKAKFIEGDILNYGQILSAMKQNIDGIVLLAGKKAVGESMENPMKYALNNINGVVNVLNAMVDAGVNKAIFSSSAAVYGVPQYSPMDEKHPVNPMSFYGFTKNETERLLKWYDQLKGIKFVSLRYFNAVGYDEDGDIKGLEENPQNLLPIVMEAAVGKRDKVKIFGNDYETRDGTCIRDYIHVTDLGSAHALALEYLDNGGESQILNLGTSQGSSVLEMINKTQEVIGRPVPYEFAPRRAGDPAVVTAKADKAKEILGWEAKHSDLENIIRSTWNVYNKQ